MKILKIAPFILIIALMMACTLSVNVPKVRTGVTQTFDINKTVTSTSDPVKVNIEMGAGTLNIASGASATIEGTVKYNVDAWMPKVETSGNEIKVSQTNTKSVGIPDGQIINTWDLKLGNNPMYLTISSGANEGTFDLSGISITDLSISDGASKTNIVFNTLNPVQMDLLEYHTGASEVKLNGLGNANVKEVTFSGGAGSYGLDFSGEMKNDINVRISAGMSDFTVTIPANARAIVTLNGGLSNVNASGTWTINGNTYQSGTTGPTIRITVDMAVGNLNLVQK